MPDLYEKEFDQWIRNECDKPYTDNTVKRYIRALKKADEWLGITLPEPLMSVGEESAFEELEGRIKANPNFDKVNQEHGHGDLSAAIRLYKQFLLSYRPDKANKTSEEGLQMTMKDTLSVIKDYIAAKGFTYDNGLIENFYLSLKSKPFVILAGTSGTGLEAEKRTHREPDRPCDRNQRKGGKAVDL